MRKLTGYIGAMIIVIALMGSILAGYALNINGTTAVMNEYEKVTDVSGLYTHTQEPAYIEYNPASNYIDYQIEQSDTFTITNTSSANYGLSYELYKNNGPNCAWNTSQFGSGAFYNNGVVVDYSTSGNQSGTNDNYFVLNGDNIRAFINVPSENNPYCIIDVINGGVVSTYYSTNFTISYASGTVTISLLDTSQTITKTTDWLIVPKNNGNYVPVCGGHLGYYQYNNVYPLTGISPTTNTVDTWGGEPVYNLYSTTYTTTNFWVFVPKTVNYQPIIDIGINYTESNRVNNYPIETDYSTITGTSTESLDLMTISAANQSNGTWVMDHSGGFYNSGSVESFWMADDYISYKLSDIISVLTPPANTKTIRFVHDMQYYQNWVYYYDVNGNSNNRVEMGYRVPYNSVSLNQTSFANAGGVNKTIIWSLGQNYVDYNVDTGLCDCFDSYGNKYRTATPSDLCFSFIPSTATTSTANLYVSGQYSYQDSVTYPIGSRPHPTINIIYTTTGTITDVHYSDITKGYSIKDTNISNTIWNNEYENGNIQLLFRAESTPGYYHNDVIIGSNNISIDYNQNKYVVTLNSNDPVDIGTWRNIILDVDLINGKLSAIPVRTFNSFTNVVTENTNIFIGDLVGSTPTSTIEWGPTPNSLLFNVYSTSVFMNTYGIVMMNPTLNITNYFTDLDNFYQLRLSGFSVYGQSMTVNGVTGNVTGNTITFNNETVQVKEMEITYADGHAYISDSYATIDLGAIVDNNVSMTGAWYFITELYDGYTTQKMVYDWDWEQFILDDKAFGVIYIGLCLIGLIVARHFCTLTVTDYIIFVVSIVFALTVPVIA